MVKIKSLLKKAKNELNTVDEEKCIELLKNSLKNIKDCEKTLKKLKESHKDLLELNIEELELNDFEW